MRREDICIRPRSPAEHNETVQRIFSRRQKFWMNGGMGVNLSTAELAVAVMAEGGIGTLSGSAPGFNARMKEILAEPAFDPRKQLLCKADEAEMLRQIDFVRAADPHGMLAVNILEPMLDFRRLVDVVGSHGGVDLLLPAAGLPRDLAKQMNQYPHMRYAPLVSGPRAAGVMIKAALNPKTGGRLPDAFYVELPQFAGGHLGAKDDLDAANLEPADPADPDGPRKFDAPVLHDQIRALLAEYRLDIPLILAGGIAYGEDISRAFALGYDEVSMGTRLLLARESGLPDHLYSKYYLDPQFPVVTAMSSPAGLPSRYIGAGNYVGNPDTERQPCVSCIGSDRCRYLKPGGKETSYCIAQWLTRTARGEEGGVLFTGSRLDEMRRDALYANGRPSVHQTMEVMFNGCKREAGA
ncbi:MAG: nitronate monooxygenase [Candidatus Peribacteraceae bacterium]|nr:nitronate monooxygenase [Candidatus Peribacteraceae bacterium]MDD5741965.1 nitronate monooxygenase [Candidatus Peribacteraceae bacterium]